MSEKKLNEQDPWPWDWDHVNPVRLGVIMNEQKLSDRLWNYVGAGIPREFAERAAKLEAELARLRSYADALAELVKLVDRADRERAIPNYLSDGLANLPEHLRRAAEEQS